MYWLILAAALAADVPAADQVREAIAAGDCDKAVAVAQKMAEAAPRDPVGAKLQGDGWRCKGDTFRAVQHYRSAVALGSADPAVARLIDTLGKTLGAVKVTISGYDTTLGAPTVALARGPEVIAAAVSAPPDWTFTDLPIGEPLELRVSGPGITPVAEPIGPLAKGQQAEKALAVVQMAPLLLVLPAWTASASVELVQGTTRAPLAAGTHPLTPGAITLVVSTSNGIVTESYDTKAGQRLEIRIDDLVPGLLSVIGVPVGSALTWVDASGKSAPVVLPDGPASMSDEVGLQILGAVPVTGLRTGEFDLQVAHPVLGTSRQSVLVVGGEVTTVRVDPLAFPNGAALQAAYARWKAEAQADRSGRVPGKVWLAGGGTLASMGLATVGVLGTLSASDRLDEARAGYDTSIAEEDAVQARADYEAIGGAKRSHVLPILVTGVGAGGTAVFATVSISGWSQARKGRKDTPWVPESALPAPVPAALPAPAAAPAPEPAAAPAPAPAAAPAPEPAPLPPPAPGPQ